MHARFLFPLQAFVGGRVWPAQNKLALSKDIVDLVQLSVNGRAIEPDSVVDHAFGLEAVLQFVQVRVVSLYSPK